MHCRPFVFVFIPKETIHALVNQLSDLSHLYSGRSCRETQALRIRNRDILSFQWEFTSFWV